MWARVTSVLLLALWVMTPSLYAAIQIKELSESLLPLRLTGVAVSVGEAREAVDTEIYLRKENQNVPTQSRCRPYGGEALFISGAITFGFQKIPIILTCFNSSDRKLTVVAKENDRVLILQGELVKQKDFLHLAGSLVVKQKDAAHYRLEAVTR